MKVALLGPYPWQVAETFFDRLPGAGPVKVSDGKEEDAASVEGQGVGGGVDTTMLALVRGMVECSAVDLHVVVSVPGISESRSEGLRGFTLHCVPNPRGDRLLWHRPSVRWLDRILATIGPDIVHAQMTGHYADAALRSRRPAVITVQGIIRREAVLARTHSSLPVKARWMMDAWYERWVLWRARDLVVTSPYSIDEMRPFTPAEFHEIENPVPDEFFTVPQMECEGPGSHRLCCPARVIPRKDILTLLQAFADVRTGLPDAMLEIAGQTDADPEYMAACLRSTERMALGASVRFLGNLRGAALSDSYARAQVVVLSSRQETAPLAISEAMAAGRPVVATSVGGVDHMVADGHTGLLVEPGDAHKLARAIMSLLVDRERCVTFGRAARAEAERRFRVTAVVNNTLALYTSLLQRQAKPGGRSHGMGGRAGPPLHDDR